VGLFYLSRYKAAALALQHNVPAWRINAIRKCATLKEALEKHAAMKSSRR